MYDDESIARSIRRYLGLMLAAPWSIALQREEVRDDRRPAGSIELGLTRVRRARVSTPQGEREMFKPVTIALYPPVLDGTTPLDPRVAGATARRLASNVLDLLMVGVSAPVLLASGRSASGPERLPLWNYDGVPPGTVGPTVPHDVLWVEDYSVRPIQDPLESRRWSVIAELRVSWEAPGRTIIAPTVTGMPGSSTMA